MLIKIQPDATVRRYLFIAKSLYMFRVSQHPSSGVLKTVTAASGTGHNIGTATSLQHGLIGRDQATLEGSSCTSIMTYTGGCGYGFLVLLMMGAVTPETCTVNLQLINICVLLHLVGFLLTCLGIFHVIFSISWLPKLILLIIRAALQAARMIAVHQKHIITICYTGSSTVNRTRTYGTLNSFSFPNVYNIPHLRVAVGNDVPQLSHMLVFE